MVLAMVVMLAMVAMVASTWVVVRRKAGKKIILGSRRLKKEELGLPQMGELFVVKGNLNIHVLCKINGEKKIPHTGDIDSLDVCG